ncbi:hypothetical protein ACE6H2_016546 [Prunus campanulata]
MQLNIFYMQVCRRTPHTGTYYYAITTFAVNHNIKMQVSRDQINACLHCLRRKTEFSHPLRISIWIERTQSRYGIDLERKDLTTQFQRREQYLIEDVAATEQESAIADEPTFDSWSLGRYWVRRGFFWMNIFQEVGWVING